VSRLQEEGKDFACLIPSKYILISQKEQFMLCNVPSYISTNNFFNFEGGAFKTRAQIVL
jgi:hypothetical protein